MIIRHLLTNTFLPRLYLNSSILLFHIISRLNILVTMPSMLNTNIIYSLVHLFLGLNRHRVSCLSSVSTKKLFHDIYRSAQPRITKLQ